MEVKTLTKQGDLQQLVGKKLKLIPSGKSGVVESIAFDTSENILKNEGIIIVKFVDDKIEKFAKGDSGFDYQILD